ncbi:hypothetical protein BVI434_1860023 [Burkholderia vietnamiensis]|nr:hypothetical protein BVI434_1860023 [Burkholderia vietnamiensis]
MSLYSSRPPCGCAFGTPCRTAQILILLLVWSLSRLCVEKDRKPPLLFAFCWTLDRAESLPRQTQPFSPLPWSPLKMFSFGWFCLRPISVGRRASIDKSNNDRCSSSSLAQAVVSNH